MNRYYELHGHDHIDEREDYLWERQKELQMEYERCPLCGWTDLTVEHDCDDDFTVFCDKCGDFMVQTT